MGDTTVTKVDAAHSPHGPHGEKYLASGVRTSMRLWEEAPGDKSSARDPSGEEDVARDYEVVGYVLSGRAELHTEGQMVTLTPGDSYVVPRGAHHHYRILEGFRAVEATSPPAHVHGRDEPEHAEPLAGGRAHPASGDDAMRAGAGRTDEVDAKHGIFPPGVPHPPGAETRAPGTIGGAPYEESGRGGPAPLTGKRRAT